MAIEIVTGVREGIGVEVEKDAGAKIGTGERGVGMVKNPTTKNIEIPARKGTRVENESSIEIDTVLIGNTMAVDLVEVLVAVLPIAEADTNHKKKNFWMRAEKKGRR